MQFTKETPKEAGWYWLKPDTEYWPGLPEGVQKPIMVAVHKWNDKFWFEDTVNREEYECPADGRLWAGPILPPEEADQTRERLSAYAHDAWSGWMRYMFGKCVDGPHGALTIPAWDVKRWTRQMKTDYQNLPEPEKESDRAEADKMLAIFGAT